MPARFLLPVPNNWHTLNDDEREKLHNGSPPRVIPSVADGSPSPIMICDTIAEIFACAASPIKNQPCVRKAEV